MQNWDTPVVFSLRPKKWQFTLREQKREKSRFRDLVGIYDIWYYIFEKRKFLDLDHFEFVLSESRMPIFFKEPGFWLDFDKIWHVSSLAP